VSQAAVLPHVDLVVHHGGSGTMLGAFAAGKPQLVVPQGADQFTNADAVVSSGAGSRLLPAELTSDAVTVTARALLADEDAHAASRRLAEEIAAMPSPREVAGYRISSVRVATSDSVNRSRRPVMPFPAVTPQA
jgi:UDP:flavonoid glycosyltransferase YjiC (YdhE family)